jgi:hypothetical protein
MGKKMTASEFDAMVEKMDKLGDGVFKISSRISAVVIVAITRDGEVAQTSNMPPRQVAAVYRQLADILDSKSSSGRTTNLRHN